MKWSSYLLSFFQIFNDKFFNVNIKFLGHFPLSQIPEAKIFYKIWNSDFRFEFQRLLTESLYSVLGYMVIAPMGNLCKILYIESRLYKENLRSITCSAEDAGCPFEVLWLQTYINLSKYIGHQSSYFST